LALKAGLSAAEFWELTPLETRSAIRSTLWRIKQDIQREHIHALTLAWWNNALARTKRMPNLESLLKKVEPSQASKLPLEERAKEFEELKRRRRYGRIDTGHSPDRDPGGNR